MSVMMVQTKCRLNNTELFLKLFHIQCKEIGNNRTQLKNGKVIFRLNNNVEKEMEDSRLDAIERLKTSFPFGENSNFAGVRHAWVNKPIKAEYSNF